MGKGKLVLVIGIILIVFIFGGINVSAESIGVYHFNVTSLSLAQPNGPGSFIYTLNGQDKNGDDAILGLFMQKRTEGFLGLQQDDEMGILYNNNYESSLSFNGESYFCSGTGSFIKIGSVDRYYGAGVLNCFAGNSNDNEGRLSLSFNIVSQNPPSTSNFFGSFNIIADESITKIKNLQSIQSSQSNQISNQSQRISLLESWKESITSLINNLLNKTDNHEERIQALEDQQSPVSNSTIPNYFKYLSSSDRKSIVCGYAKDNHQTQILDLGWNCTITYRTSSRGETANCKCKQLETNPSSLSIPPHISNSS